jgi:hypothetical protein
LGENDSVNSGKHTPQVLRVVAETSPRPDLVVVLGMHRAGTSALARGLKALGVELGDRMMAPSATENPTGYWEDLDIYELNVSMMKALGRDWHSLRITTSNDVEFLRRSGYMLRASELLRSKTQHTRTFGFKDPRLAVLLPFWKEVFAARLAEVAYVIAVRNPLSVTRSLATRNAMASEKSYYLWLEHMLASLELHAGSRHVLMDYDCLMAAPREQLQRVADALGMEIDQAEVAQYESEFLDSSLRHTEYTVADLELDPACPSLVADVYRELQALAQHPGCLETEHLASKLTGWRRDLHTLQPALQFADGLLERLESATRDLNARNSEAAELVQGLQARSTELEAARHTLSTLSARTSELESAVESRDAAIGSLRAEGAELQQLREKLGATLDEMARREVAASELQRKVLSEQETAAQREASIAEMQFEINAIREAATGREGLVLQLQHELDSSRHAAAEEASALQQLLGQRELEQLESSQRAANAEAECRRLELDLAKARSEAALQASLLEQREVAHAKLQREVDALGEASTRREQVLDRLQQELRASRDAAVQASAEFDAFVRRVETDRQAASTRAEQSEVERERLTDALVVAQREAASQSAEMERALVEAREREALLREDLSREASELTLARAQIAHLAKAIEERDASIATLRTTLDTFDSNLEELTLQSVELDRQMALSAERHVRDMAAADDSLRVMTSQYDAARQELSAATLSLETHTKALAALSSDVHELRQRSEAVERDNARLRDQLGISQGEAGDLRRNLEMLATRTSDRLSLMGGQLTEERIAKEELLRSLIDANTRMDHLRASWSWRVTAPFRALGRRRPR